MRFTLPKTFLVGTLVLLQKFFLFLDRGESFIRLLKVTGTTVDRGQRNVVNVRIPLHMALYSHLSLRRFLIIVYVILSRPIRSLADW